MKYLRFLLVALLAWLMLDGVAVAQTQIPEYPFLIITDHDAEAPVMTDSLFNALASGIQFKVSRTEVNRQSPFFKTWRQLLPRLKREGVQIRRLYLRGAASPEGPIDKNQMLGKARTDSLLSIISHDLATSDIDVPMSASSITEDYGYLVTLMGLANDPDYAVVRDIVTANAGYEAATKLKLMRYQNGTLWRRLKAEYFPRLRSARIVLWLALPAQSVSLPDVSTVKAGPLSITDGAQSILAQMADAKLTVMPFTPYTTVTTDSVLVRRHLLAARTNLIYDGWYQPQFGWAPGMNIQLEYYPLDGHLTYNAGFTFHNHRHWSDYKFFQVRDVDLEARWYLQGGGAFVGPYASVNAHGSWYGIGFSKTKGWEGEGAGAGVNLGWVWNLSRSHRWRLEASLGAGYFYTRHDPYVYGNILTGEEDGKYYYDYTGAVSTFKRRNHRFQWLGPTQVGISITYDILYRKVQKRGVGVRRTEEFKGSSQLQKGGAQ